MNVMVGPINYAPSGAAVDVACGDVSRQHLNRGSHMLSLARVDDRHWAKLLGDPVQRLKVLRGNLDCSPTSAEIGFQAEDPGLLYSVINDLIRSNPGREVCDFKTNGVISANVLPCKQPTFVNNVGTAEYFSSWIGRRRPSSFDGLEARLVIHRRAGRKRRTVSDRRVLDIQLYERHLGAFLKWTQLLFCTRRGPLLDPKLPGIPHEKKSTCLQWTNRHAKEHPPAPETLYVSIPPWANAELAARLRRYDDRFLQYARVGNDRIAITFEPRTGSAHRFREWRVDDSLQPNPAPRGLAS